MLYARSLRHLLGFLSCVLVAPALTAQKFDVQKITFVGYPEATEAELMTASGMQAGVPLDQPEIQAAAEKLSGTGLFTDVRFAYDGSELKFTLKPADGAVPVRFVNFPWWDHKSLDAALVAKVPLFHGKVIPDSGLQLQVTSALTSLVAGKGVQAKISARSLAVGAAGPAGKIVGVDFKIDSPRVQIADVKFANVNPAFAAPVAAIERSAMGTDFNETSEASLQATVRAVYHRDGYLDFTLTKYAHEPQLAGGKVGVPISATIVQGPQYRVAGLTVSGDVLMTQAEFAKRAKLHVGDVANEDLLQATLAEIAAPYKARGYLRASVQATPSFDRTAHFDRPSNSVSYAITVVPGPVFHMGKLTIANLDDEKKAIVLKYWTMHEGAPFDATYGPGFLNRNKNDLHALDGWSATYKQYENDDTHVVDLVIAFRQGAA